MTSTPSSSEIHAPVPAAVPAAVPTGGSRLASIAVASALFMEFIDSTALSTALPALSVAFGSDPVHLKLALTSYILALAVVAPASGWIADRYGPRRVFLTAMCVFLAGSVLCGFSHSLGELVLFRTLQGVGGALMVPVGRLIVVSSAPRERLVSAMSWFTMPALVGPLVGPPLAGFILNLASWPWIFFINVPVGVLGMLAVMRFVPALHQPYPGRFDTRGFALAASAITALVGASELVGMGLVPAAVQVGLWALALALLGAYVHHALKVERPVLNVRLVSHDTYRASLVGGTVVRVGLGATPFLLPLLYQVGLGWGPLQTGLVTVGTAVGAMACKPVAPGIIRRFGFRSILIYSNLLTGAFTALPAFFRASTPVALMVLALSVTGFIRSLQFTALNTVAYADIPQSSVSNASTLSVVTQQMGLSLGISFGGLMLHLARGNSQGALTPTQFILPFVAVGVVTTLAGPLFRRMSPNAGANIRGQSATA